MVVTAAVQEGMPFRAVGDVEVRQVRILGTVEGRSFPDGWGNPINRFGGIEYWGKAE